MDGNTNKYKLKAVIFDLDGVICFTDTYHYQAWKAIADAQGIYFDEKINNRLRGVSRMDSLDIILERSERSYSAGEKEKLARQKNEIYRDLLKKMTPEDLPQDVKATLEALKERELKVAVGSSSKNTKMILRQIGLEGFFHAVSDGTNITFSKPNPEVFLKAADMLGLQPGECLVVEDAEAGIQAAHNGGFLSAGLGAASDYEWTDYPLKRVSDILNVIK
ncbi:MAG: beta-phosphoglucomutase [Lachnospiraceae bacterium]|nr:beta-phosphoglucomutase [Lachnospiraceae bacterium]